MKKIKLVPLALTLTLVLGKGCSSLASDKNDNKSKITIETIDTPDIAEDCIKGIKPLLNTTNNDYTKINVNLSNETIEEFQGYLNNLENNYKLADLYHMKESINQYNKYYSSNVTYHHKKDLSDFNDTTLFNIVKNNNKEYLKNSKYALYDELKDDELKSICKIIINTCNDFMKENDSIDKDRLSCLLSDLKIFSKPSMNNAYIDNINNCFVLSKEMLEVAKLINGENTDYDIIVHEIVHLLQKGCNCENHTNLEYHYGFSYSFDNLKINSINFSWFYEASAEKNMCNYTHDKLLVYKYMVNYLDTISMVNVLNDNFDINETEQTSLNKDLNSVYDLFNVETNQDKEEILNMMYSLQIIQMKPDDFYDEYQQINQIDIIDNSIVDKINCNLKNPICKTFTKYFYRNLSNNIKNKNVSLGDIFYLISMFECDLNSHLDYDKIKNYEVFNSFYNYYLDVQNNFFYLLSQNTNYSQEEIEYLFNNYSCTLNMNGNKVNNYNLNWLSLEKVEYIDNRLNSIEKYKSVNINTSIEEIEEYKQGNKKTIS